MGSGLVGNDGATHHGTFDLAYMGCVPDIVIMAPSDECELQNMVETAYSIDNRPSVVRYPRANGYGSDVLYDLLKYNTENILPSNELPPRGQVLPIGKGRIAKKGVTTTSSVGKRTYRVSIISIGTRLVESILAARAIEEKHGDVVVTVSLPCFAGNIE